MPSAMALTEAAPATEDWGQADDYDEYSASIGAAFGGQSACRSMFQGAWRLLFFRPRAPTRVDEILEPVKLQRKKGDKPDPTGTLPHRAVKLKPAAINCDLYLSFSWIGSADLSGLCLLVEENGKLLETLWQERPGSLGRCGVQVLPMESFAADAVDAGAFALRLRHVPESVHAMLFCLAAWETEREDTPTAFESVNEAEVRLSTALGAPHVWRYRQGAPQDMANTWLCAVLYRGPFGQWHLEPLSMKFLVMALKDCREEEAVLEAARNLAWRLRWLAKDRRWAAAERERGLRREE